MDWQNVFMFKQIASQQSWLEPTQSAKDQCTHCETEKCSRKNPGKFCTSQIVRFERQNAKVNVAIGQEDRSDLPQIKIHNQ